MALIVIGWLILLVWLFLHFANKGAGAFFLQERPGKDGKIYKVIKFKTMTDERDADGKLLPDEQRLTKVNGIDAQLVLPYSCRQYGTFAASILSLLRIFSFMKRLA